MKYDIFRTTRWNRDYRRCLGDGFRFFHKDIPVQKALLIGGAFYTVAFQTRPFKTSLVPYLPYFLARLIHYIN